MPKRVDHDQRRREIADALVRTACARGLHQTGFREVAAEAGVSVNLVQHYFGSKESLLLGGLRRVVERSAERVAGRLAELPAGAGPSDRLAVALGALLPVDAEGRELYVVHSAYAALALTDQRLAEQPYLRDAARLEERLVEVFEEAGAEGRLADHVGDSRRAAVELIALTSGLAGLLITGQQSAELVESVLRERLADLFTAGPTARRSARPSGGTREPD